MQRFVLSLAAILVFQPAAWGLQEVWMSHGRAPDPTAKIISEIRESERRQIPLEVTVRVRAAEVSRRNMPVTVTITNLFSAPLLLNSRLLINHELLPGEISFVVTGPDGKRCTFSQLVSPLMSQADDFVVLERGMSLERQVNLAEFFALHGRGTYRIAALYHNQIEQSAQGLRAWVGSVASDPINVDVP